MPSTPMNGETLLEVEDLRIRFRLPKGEIIAVDGASFSLAPGEILGIVGESGSGKSQILLSILGLLAANGKAEGRVRFSGEDILNRPQRELDRWRGTRMAMIFQDPMTSLNPYMRVGRQLTEILTLHRGLDAAAAKREAIAMLARVRIPEPERRFDLYPHEFSGGMRQRAMIAMALLCRPALILADEPTTALDVTVQAQILALLAELARDTGAAIILVTHDLGIVAKLCDRVIVLYGGRIMEEAPIRDLFAHPHHPYAAGLLAATPSLDHEAGGELPTIPGQPRAILGELPGCPFAPRCAERTDLCDREMPPLRKLGGASRRLACHHKGGAA